MRRRRGTYRSLYYALVLVLMLGGEILYMTDMPSKSWSGMLPPLTMEQTRLADHLRKHIAVLSEEIGERNLWRDGTLDATADYIEETFQAMGYAVTSQAYTVQGTSVRNLEVVLGGTSLTEEIVLVGAHYDTVSGSPGANDNVSGVAALLEIARLLAAKPLARSVRFVAFVNEEAPFFYTWEMGSHHYARRAHERGDNITAMLPGNHRLLLRR
jgi:Zn-dependent M28 family amino/carboxypeptidase